MKMWKICVLILVVLPYCVGWYVGGRRGMFYHKHELLHQQVDVVDTSTSTALPSDAVRHHYLHSPDWYYWYRRNGMQTSTDDVLVSFIASLRSCQAALVHKSSSNYIDVLQTTAKSELNVANTYVDLGCGIGSALFLVAHKLRPSQLSLGIEVQEESARLAQHSISHFPVTTHPIAVERIDLRMLKDQLSYSNFPHKIVGTCDLITGNPPYCPVGSGTLALDSQRLNARFELHGGIEDYCSTVNHLLSKNGRFVFSFWSSGHDRVFQALQKASLRASTVVKVVAGHKSNPKPYLNIYEAYHEDCEEVFERQSPEEVVLDIIRQENNRLNPDYYLIQSYLQMCPRPLK